MQNNAEEKVGFLEGETDQVGEVAGEIIQTASQMDETVVDNEVLSSSPDAVVMQKVVVKSGPVTDQDAANMNDVSDFEGEIAQDPPEHPMTEEEAAVIEKEAAVIEKEAASIEKEPAVIEKEAAVWVEEAAAMVKEAASMEDDQLLTRKHIRENVFMKDVSIGAHIYALKHAATRYLDELRALLARHVAAEFSVATKARVLAACFVAGRNAEARGLLATKAFGSVAEVVKCAQILDAPRKARQYQRKLTALEEQHAKDPASVRTRTISALRTHVHNLTQEPHPGSLSGARQRVFRKWASRIPKSQLEFFLLNFPTDSWRSLADIVHLKRSDFQLDFFLRSCFGEPAPEGTLVSAAEKLTTENLADILESHPELALCYSYIRRKCRDNSDTKKQRDAAISQLLAMGYSFHQASVAMDHNSHLEDAIDWILSESEFIDQQPKRNPNERGGNSARAKQILAERAPLATVLWWYPELACPESAATVRRRLQAGEPLHSGDTAVYELNYGKLMERCLFFREREVPFADDLLPYAEEKLKQIMMKKTRNEVKVAVFGDASGSMEVAIKSASIIGSLLSVAFRADLSFFHEESFAPPVTPTSAQGVLQVAEGVRARGATSMASALRPYFDRKERLDLIILVSDEGENQQTNGQWFSELFADYRREVSPECSVFLVSFLEGADPGIVRERLLEEGVEARQFRLDAHLPDTSKFDALLGEVWLEASGIMERWDVMEKVCIVKHKSSKDIVNMIMKF
eukprot:718989_1